MSVVKSGPPDQIEFGPGAFFCRRINSVLNVEEWCMDKRELAYAKQTLFMVKDWDAFQDVLRFWSKLMKPSNTVVTEAGYKKA
jgi:hypothetical protein